MNYQKRVRLNKKERKRQRRIKAKQQKENLETKSQEINKMSYKEYLQSKEWKAFSKKLKEGRGSCDLCLTKANLDVHHIKYKDVIYNEGKNKEWLLVVCRTCHSEIHNTNRYPFWNPFDKTKPKKKREPKLIIAIQKEKKEQDINLFKIFDADKIF